MKYIVKDTILSDNSEYINIAIMNRATMGSNIILASGWRNEVFLLRLLIFLKAEDTFSKLRNRMTCNVSWYMSSDTTLKK